MSTQIILFNGPPRSGKDTASQMAMTHLGKDGIFCRIASPLKDAVHALFGMPFISEEHFTEVKGNPRDEFLGMTPREAYIWLSEDCAKQKFGKDFFAKIAVSYIKRRALGKNDVVVIADCGFQIEVDALIEEFGSDNVWVVHILRESASFEKDSRSYVDHVKERSLVVNNNGNFYDLSVQISNVLNAVKFGRKQNACHD